MSRARSAGRARARSPKSLQAAEFAARPSAARLFHFLVLPEFSFLAFMSAVEPLRVANHFRPGSYDWKVLSLDGRAVPATNGMVLEAADAFDAASGVEAAFVLSGFNTLRHYRPAVGEWLRGLRKRGATLGAIDGGAFALAEAGLLGGAPVALHWSSHAAFLERYPGVKLGTALYETDSQCISCAGGISCIDMMLALIARDHGMGLAADISDWFILGRIRGRADSQRIAIARRHGLHNEPALQAIELMQQHLEDPLPIDDLARMTALTRRQLERLFAAHLGVPPSRYYLNLRLDRARELLQQTAMSVTEVAVACGFGSLSYFARAYRGRFELAPRGDRTEAVAAGRPGLPLVSPLRVMARRTP